MAIDDPTKAHFDLRDFRFVTYSNIAGLRRKLTEEILGTILRNHSDGEDDSNAGKFGRSAYSRGYLLTADIRPDDKTYCEITLRVIATRRGQQVQGFVKFYLHPETEDPTMRRVKSRVGEAIYELMAYGPYTVGALLEDGTKLELNLASIPGGHEKFYRS